MRSISVVLPTYNRLPRLQQVIGGLERQSYPLDLLETIVVSDGSTDGTIEYLEGLSTPLHLRVLTQNNQGPAAARNLGVKNASGELVLFLDDDVVPTPHLVSEHVIAHELHGDRVVVLGPMLTPPDFVMQPWVRWEQFMLTKQYDAMQADKWQPTARQFYTGNASLLLQHIAGAPPFDVRFRRAEDVELAYRLADQGLRFVFRPGAIGYHYAERSFESWRQTPYAYGRNDVIFAREKGQDWLLPTIGREFRGRHTYVRWLTYLCLSRPLPSAVAIAALRRIAAGGERFGSTKAWRAAYSGIYNLNHYQGIADELGGRKMFYMTFKDSQRQRSGSVLAERRGEW